MATLRTARVCPWRVWRGREGDRTSKVLMVRSLEEVCRVRGLYLFQSRERHSAPGKAGMLRVAATLSVGGEEEEGREGTGWLSCVPEFEG